MKQSDRVVVYPNYVDEELCQRIINESTFKHALHVEGGHFYDMDTYPGRMTTDTLMELEKIFDHFAEIYGPDYPRMWINVMKYTAGEGMIYRHQDTHNPNLEIQRNTYTVLLYLNTITDGGETVFFFDDEPDLIVSPTVGTIVVMPGDVYHEARIPLSQDKYIALTRHVPTN